MPNKAENLSHIGLDHTKSLKARLFHAGGWVLLSHFIGLILRLASSLVMSRLLAPEVFGTVTVAIVFQVVIALLADVGITPAIIQSPRGETPPFLNTAWTLHILRGLWIWAICLTLSLGLHIAGLFDWLPAKSAYANPILPAVLAVTSFTSVLAGFQSMKLVIRNRHLDMKRLVFIDLFSQILGLLVSGWIAYVTRSVWAFVAGNLLSTASTTLLSHIWLEGHRDRFAWDRAALSEILKFGRWIFVSSFVGVLSGNGDRLMFGAWFDASVLGYYSIALNLMGVVEGLADRLFGTISFATFSEVARTKPERFPSIYFRMRWASDLAFVFMAGFLFSSGEWIVHLLYDQRYAPVGYMLRILSFGLLFSRYRLVQKAYVALGFPRYEAFTNVAKSISLFLLVPLLYYHFGMQGALVGIAFQLFPAVLPTFWFNRQFQLNNIILEFTVVFMWPIGWLIGSAGGLLIHKLGLALH